jgi:putative zinc finger protein
MTTPSGCDAIRELLDSYLGNELLVETNHAVLQHLTGCSECSRELAARRRIREFLREALPTAPDAISVESRVLQQLPRRVSWFTVRKLAAVAALLAVVSAAWFITRSLRSPVQSSPPPPAAALLSAVYRNTLDNHVECGLALPESVTFNAARVARRLDPAYLALVDIVERESGPYHVAEAHDCSLHDTKFKHLILRGAGHTISVMTLREPPSGMPPAAVLISKPQASDPIWNLRDGRLEAAASEAAGHLTVLVSDLDWAEHEQLATRVLPPVTTRLHGMAR